MPASGAAAIVRLLASGGVETWVGGGWGIDALVGEQTRPHRDLDLAVRTEDEDRALSVLVHAGFAITEDQRPTRVVVADGDGRTVDLHPVALRPDGSAVQAGFAGTTFTYPPGSLSCRGRIDGLDVACCCADLQLAFHLGYEPQDRDRHDMQVLHDRLGVALPAPYSEDGRG